MTDPMTYQQLQAALKIFGITGQATFGQIKQRHRELVKLHHPDQSGETNPASIREINNAYKILTTYCSDYRYSFSEAEFLEQNPAERLRRQFGWDPVWSGRKEE